VRPDRGKPAPKHPKPTSKTGKPARKADKAGRPMPTPASRRQRLEFFEVSNWQGSALHKEDRKRSIDPDQLAPLFAMDGVDFVSLHFGAEDGRLPEGLRDIGSHVSDFADAASTVKELDLVISVDTATVHLAGALGVQTWCLLPFVPTGDGDWRVTRPVGMTVLDYSVRRNSRIGQVLSKW